jgi:hypothetical protein
MDGLGMSLDTPWWIVATYCDQSNFLSLGAFDPVGAVRQAETSRIVKIAPGRWWKR